MKMHSYRKTFLHENSKGHRAIENKCTRCEVVRTNIEKEFWANNKYMYITPDGKWLSEEPPCLS